MWILGIRPGDHFQVARRTWALGEVGNAYCIRIGQVLHGLNDRKGLALGIDVVGRTSERIETNSKFHQATWKNCQ